MRPDPAPLVPLPNPRLPPIFPTHVCPSKNIIFSRTKSSRLPLFVDFGRFRVLFPWFFPRSHAPRVGTGPSRRSASMSTTRFRHTKNSKPECFYTVLTKEINNHENGERRAKRFRIWSQPQAVVKVRSRQAIGRLNRFRCQSWLKAAKWLPTATRLLVTFSRHYQC